VFQHLNLIHGDETMLALILAEIPGSVFFKALSEGQPMAFVMLGGVITLIGFAFVLKYIISKSK